MIKQAFTWVILSAAWPVLAASEASAGAAKAARCVACHGGDGKSAVPIYPHLAGQNAPYLQHALQAYKTGERNGGQAEVMKAFVAGLSDEDMEDLSAYYAAMKP
ncbi:cytochrome c [Pantoea sp. Mb-10]|uniref:c-type cytochrome n=1 Tax=unclassified Pantoea TaxID=2630326 RepID=UPI001E47BBAB|nr:MULTISPECIES: cytochrome c [unclassified Pantoea]MCE0490636.1 cytochrome c [Pantoea sp. Mb-10]MCE0501767.1 cytochrome c [Pantoea sp. Pb-8]